jgi:hypothetical protein
MENRPSPFAEVRGSLITAVVLGVALKTAEVHIAHMADTDEKPVMMPFQNQAGTGWHVIVRYHQGHERRIEGFATEDEAVDWISANSTQVDKEP